MTKPKPKAEPMFPAGEDLPLISGVPAVAHEIGLPELVRLTAVDPAAQEGSQSVLFVVEPDTFNPTALLLGLSSGAWTVAQRGLPIAGHGFKITTNGQTDREYPVALAVTAADAAVLAQAKHLLMLVIRAFQVPASKIADPDWESFRTDARRVLDACAPPAATE